MKTTLRAAAFVLAILGFICLLIDAPLRSQQISGGGGSSCGVGQLIYSSNADTGLLATTSTITADSTTDLITWGTTTPFAGNAAVNFTNSGGGLPGGISTATTYYTIPGAGNTFKIATTVANAIAGTNIDITSNGTGTNTGIPTVILTSGNSYFDLGGVSLPAGTWDLSLNWFIQSAISSAYTQDGGTITPTSVTGNNIPTALAFQAYPSNNTVASLSRSLGQYRVTPGSTTTYFGSVRATWSTSTVSAYGKFEARKASC